MRVIKLLQKNRAIISIFPSFLIPFHSRPNVIKINVCIYPIVTAGEKKVLKGKHLARKRDHCQTYADKSQYSCTRQENTEQKMVFPAPVYIHVILKGCSSREESSYQRLLQSSPGILSHTGKIHGSPKQHRMEGGRPRMWMEVAKEKQKCLI